MFLDFDSYVAKMITFVFPENCFEEFFYRYNFLDDKCTKLVLSRVLGLGVTVGSSLGYFRFAAQESRDIVLIPQILKIQTARSGRGISLLAFLLNLIACIGTSGYSYKQQFVFSQWGDAFFMTLQVAVIILQILFFAGRNAEAFVFALMMGGLGTSIYLDAIPLAALTGMQAATIPITVVAKSLQIYANFSNQSTGQLSGVSVFLQFAGCLARIFTSMQETNDQLVVVTYIVASILNGILFSQIFMYWGSKPIKKRQ